MTELQHFIDGIAPNTIIEDDKGNSWKVKSRILSGNLMLIDSEVIFDKETSLDHISNTYSDEEKRNEATLKEKEKREQGIYWYLLVPTSKKNKQKPKPNGVLEIKTHHNT